MQSNHLAFTSTLILYISCTSSNEHIKVSEIVAVSVVSKYDYKVRLCCERFKRDLNRDSRNFGKKCSSSTSQSTMTEVSNLYKFLTH